MRETVKARDSTIQHLKVIIAEKETKLAQNTKEIPTKDDDELQKVRQEMNKLLRLNEFVHNENVQLRDLLQR